MPESDFGRMGQILRRIFHTSNKFWSIGTTPEGEKVVETILDDYEKLLIVMPPINEGKLHDVLKKPRYNKLVLDKPIYLPPLKQNREFIPMIGKIKWKLGNIFDISIRIHMFRFIQMFPDGDRSHLRSIGFRFDFHGKSRTHNFMHIQLTHQNCPDWLPTHLPCIPTKALGPVSLLFCALASLYGKNMYNMFFSGMRMPGNYLEPLREFLTIQKK